MIINARIPPEAAALLEEATERGIGIEYRDDELYTSAPQEKLTQEDLEEFTRRLTEHREHVAAAIVLFSLAERNGEH